MRRGSKEGGSKKGGTSEGGSKEGGGKAWPPKKRLLFQELF